VLTDRLGEAFEQKMAEIHPKDDKKSDSTAHNAFRSSNGRGTVFLAKRSESRRNFKFQPGDFVPLVTAPASASAIPIAPTPSNR
jgi:hypothetical protein